MSADAASANSAVSYSPLHSTSQANYLPSAATSAAAIPSFDRSALPTWGPRPGELSGAGLVTRCFGAGCELPGWLVQPGVTLEAVGERRRPIAARLGDLARMVDQVDDLFGVHLPLEWHRFKHNTFEPSSEKVAAGLCLHEVLPRWVDHLFEEATQVLRRQLLPDLAESGVVIKPVVQVDEWQRAWLHHYFTQRVYPLLTPLAVDPGHPFPFISNDSLNLLVELRRLDSNQGGSPDNSQSWSQGERSSLFARVKIPHTAPRLIAVPNQPMARWSEPTLNNPATPTTYVWTADLVRFFVHHLFPGMPVRHVYLFRVVRGEAPLPGMTRPAPARHRRQEDRPVVRLDVEQRMGEPVLAWLTEHLRLPSYAVARHDNLLEWLCLPHLVECLPKHG